MGLAKDRNFATRRSSALVLSIEVEEDLPGRQSWLGSS